MRSVEVVRRTGATYRMLDYWTRLGLFGDQHGFGKGSGNVREYDDHQVVLARALVILGTLVGHPAYRRFHVEPQILSAWFIDPLFRDWWLIGTEDAIVVEYGFRLRTPACVVVSLAECAAVLRDDDDDDEPVAVS